MINGKTVLCEVGCGPLSMCYASLVWGRPDFEVLLFEPNPTFYAQLIEAASGRENVKIHNVAIGDENGMALFIEEGTSSSLAGIDSPVIQHRGIAAKTSYPVVVKKIS